MSKREPQIILKPDERSAGLELGRDGKFAAKSNGWDEKVFSSRATSSRSPSRTDAGAARLPAGPRPAIGPVQHYFRTEE